MIRKNEDRTGPRSKGGDQVDPASLLNFVTPTEFVELPSQGRGYPDGHPLQDQETIEIRFMTAKDEDILTSRSLLKKGIALERLMNNLIVHPDLRAKDVMVGDRNAIIIAARASAYGPKYETKVSCPACNATQKHVFDLLNPMVYHGVIDDEYDVTPTDSGTYVIKTPHSGIDVEVKLLMGSDEMEILKAMKNKKAKDEEAMTSQMRLFIVSVNGHKQEQVIKHFISKVPAAEARYVRNAYKKLAPDLRITGDFECESCGFEQELEVPFGADFFWPDR
tara:strand:+ start:2138 stop:2971 length:834 start_codon:yes stop_codon:yes gene_type:complete